MRVLLLLLLMVLFSMAGIALWYVVSGDGASVSSLKWLQVINSLTTFFLPCLVAACLWSKQPMQWLGMNKGVDWKVALSVVVLMIIALPAINLLAWINQQMVLPDFLRGLEELMQSKEEEAAVLTERLIKADNLWVLFANVIVMALLPALCEETMFRGTLQQLVCHNQQGLSTKQHIAIWTSAIIFSTIHFQFYGFMPRMLLGALLGYLFVWFGSLWLPVLAHFTNNAMAVILYNIYYMNGKSTDEIDALGTESTLWLGIVSLIITCVGIWGIYRAKKVAKH